VQICEDPQVKIHQFEHPVQARRHGNGSSGRI
jgi:hypothetical protein